MVEPGRLKIYENGDWRYVGYGPASSVATDLSDVTIDVDKDWNAKNITNLNSLTATTIVCNSVDGVDVSAVSANINQDVKTTASPTFAAITVTGNVDGVDLSAFKSDYDAKVNQDVKSTASPTFVIPKCNSLILGVSSASDTLQISNDTEKQQNNNTYVKKKSIIINSLIAGSYKVKFDLKTMSSGLYAYGKLQKNGVDWGSEQSVLGETYTTKSQTFSNTLFPGDVIDLYLHADPDVGWVAYCKNFRICYTLTPSTAMYTNNDP